MRSMWKYPLTREDYVARAWPGPRAHLIRMPRGAVIRYVDDQRGVPTLWAEVPDSNAERDVRGFYVICTGDPVPASATYIGSYTERGQQDDPSLFYVYHVYEETV